MILITAIDVPLFRNAKKTGEVFWGRIPVISQYTLIFIAVSFTWLMGLMGYVRSGLRQHWHVYGVVRDTSPDAFTPTLGFATQVVSITVLIFFGFIGLVFWLASLPGAKDWEPKAMPVPLPAGAAAAAAAPAAGVGSASGGLGSGPGGGGGPR
jgi:cytochrome bd-type quinol oxidase subunit 1